MRGKILIVIGLVLVAMIFVSCTPAAPVESEAPAAPVEVEESEAEVDEPEEVEEPEAEVEVIRIGVSQPLSGPDGRYGEVIVPAYEYAVKQVNESGGIHSMGGAQLEIVWSDHQSSAEVAISEMERLVEQEGVSVIAGANLSGIVLASTTATERLQVPYVVDVPAHADITLRGFEYVFRTNVSAAWYGVTFAEFMEYLNAEYDADIQKVAIAYRDVEFPTSVQDAVYEHAMEEGFDVVFREPYPADAPDLTTFGTRVRGTDPDVISVADNSVAFATLWSTTLRDLAVNPDLIITSNGAYEFAEWYDEVGDPIRDGWMLMVQWNGDLADPALAGDYASFTDQPLNGHTLLSMQAVYVIAEALEMAGSSDPQAIRDALAELRIEPGPRLVMPWDYLEYDETGQNTGAQNVVVQWQDGQLVTVYPQAFANAEPIVPFDYWQR